MMVRVTALVDEKSCKIEKVAYFIHFEQKNTHISGCKIVPLCTIVTVAVHICMVTVIVHIIILYFFPLTSLLSPFDFSLSLSLSLSKPI